MEDRPVPDKHTGGSLNLHGRVTQLVAQLVTLGLGVSVGGNSRNNY